MNPEDCMTWLAPIEAWIKANVQLESDPDEKWHLALIAWNQIKECHASMACGDAPMWVADTPLIDLEPQHEPVPDDSTPAAVNEMSDLQEDNQSTGGANTEPAQSTSAVYETADDSSFGADGSEDETD